MPDNGIHLFMLRDVDEPLPQLLERVGETEFTGIEFAEWVHGLAEADQRTIDDVGVALEETQLTPISARLGLSGIEENLEKLCTTYGQLGCERFVASGMDDSYFESIASVKEGANALERVADALAEHDIDLHYHNHVGEFVEIDGAVPFEILINETEQVKFEIDIAWAGIDGVDLPELIGCLETRMEMIHFKDVDIESGTDVEVGTGDLDLEAIVAAANAADVSWLVYELDEPANPLQSLEHGSETIARLNPEE